MGINALSFRDRAVGAVLILVTIGVQTWCMGWGVTLLSAGLVIAYVVWAAARWKNEPAVLPMFLAAIVVQCLHVTEEYVTGFPRQFPEVMGGDTWSDTRFLAFNMIWLSLFVLAAVGVYRRVKLAYLGVIFLALIGGVGNGASHLFLSAIFRRYFPGAITAPVCLIVGLALLAKLFRRSGNSAIRSG
jgi:Protein of unknown function with HXXEE motif